jgi:hypothetical protein
MPQNIKMNMNARFLNEAKMLESRWNKSGLLDGIKDRWSRPVTAVLLESQRLINETPNYLEDFKHRQRVAMLEAIISSSS